LTSGKKGIQPKKTPNRTGDAGPGHRKRDKCGGGNSSRRREKGGGVGRGAGKSGLGQEKGLVINGEGDGAVKEWGGRGGDFAGKLEKTQ